MSMSMSSCPDSPAKDRPKGAERLGRLLAGVIKSLGAKEHLGKEEIELAWRAAAGGSAATHSRPVSYKRGTLVVNVENSSWLYELTTHKKDIISKLEKGLEREKIKELRFRIGDIGETR